MVTVRSQIMVGWFPYIKRSPLKLFLARALIVGLICSWNPAAADLVYTVPEELPPGSHIGYLAEDTDLRQYVSAENLPTLRYSFLASDSDHVGLFRLNEATGELRTAPQGRLDREAVCPFLTQCLLSLQVAIQSTLDQFFRKVSVNINITDVNDNSPVFPAPSTSVVVSESVQVPSSFPLPSAQDLDTGPHHSLAGYRIVPDNGPFAVSWSPDNPGPMLVVKEELDRELTPRYQVQVIARDGGQPPRTGALLVNITVGDENDNVPRFTLSSYSITVNEDVPRGHVLLKMTATDEDSGPNGQVRYRLSSQQSSDVTSMFSIDAITGELSVVGDIENGREGYELMVEARDLGSPPFTASTTVSITVRDTINSKPKLTVSLLRGDGFSTISEYASLGAVVAHIAVRDPDGGRNGIVQCRMEPQPYFELQGFDIKEYKVIVARQLDRETVAAHNVTVVCTDAGVQPQSASTRFEVRVTDENDNSPRFSKRQFRVDLPENSVQGRSLLTVTASDADAGDNGRVRYSLHPDARGRFVIAPDSGVIVTHDDFDHETEPEVNFTVIATDGGDPPRSDAATITVSITDVNDQRPSFSRDTFSFSVSEAALRGAIVGRVTASDFEQGLNGQVDISPDIPSIARTPFTVLPNGSVVLTGPLDHEFVTFYVFNVTARDRGMPPLNDTAQVQISVIDENDNRPRVTYPNGSDLVVYVSMDDDIARPVAMVQAEDADSGLNGQLQFIVTARNDSGRFDVDANSGEVFITRALGSGDINTYRLQVLVQDSGSPPLPAVRPLTIWVHAGNGTGGQSGAQVGDHYLLITLAIVCITIILSAVIVLIIVVMRRMDRRHKGRGGPMHIHNTRVLGSYADTVKADNMHNECVDGGIHEKEWGGGGFETFGKGLSEEDADFGFSPLGGSSMEGGGPGESNKLSMSSDNLSNQQPVEDAPGPPASQLPVTASHDNDLDLEALQIHQMLLQSYHESNSASSADQWQMGNRGPDDQQSDSSGETIPSDSGRGGSEEDVSHAGHLGMAMNDHSRLASLHDPSFLSTMPGSSHHLYANSHNPVRNAYSYNPSKSSVRDPVRNGSRKHVTFKDLSAGKRLIGVRPLRAGTPALAGGVTAEVGVASTALREPSRQGGGVSNVSRSMGNLPEDSKVFEPPRYTQPPFRNSPRPTVSHFSAGGGNPGTVATDLSRGSLVQLNSSSPGLDASSSGSSLDSQRSPTVKADSPRSSSSVHGGDFPRGVNIPPPPGAVWTKTGAFSACEGVKVGSLLRTEPAGSSFRHAQEMQTFHPPRTLTSRQSSKELPRSLQPCPRESPLGLQEQILGAKDWRGDSGAATDDGDDQRSTTTTSGSYTLDNEDTYVGLDVKQSPWKDIVV